jgi:excisionase family DNA binding protein
MSRTRAKPHAAPVVLIPRPPSSLGLLTLQEAADELRLSKATVSVLVARGTIKAIRPIPGGKTVRIFRADLQAYIDGLRGGDK